MLVNPSFERWSGKTLLDWSSSSSQAHPAQDGSNVVDGHNSVRFDCDANQQTVALEQPIHVLGGRSYLVRFYYRTQIWHGSLWAEIGPPGDPTPKMKNPLAESLDWQEIVIEFNAQSAGTLVLRLRASNASGTLWLDDFSLRLK